MKKDSDHKLEPEHARSAGIFFASERPVHEKEMHPLTVISMLKAELRRSQEHVQELYKRIAELKGRDNAR
tara:strand:- start:33 stop:242 length:210 start_codon:yes stop_codon:yes gene_type:complete